jgi:protease-4
MLEQVLQDLVAERRRARRWGIFFKSLMALYFFWVLGLYAFSGGGSGGRISLLGGKHTALVNVSGLIASGMEASADNIIGSLKDAFEDKGTKGIILRVDSPGGNPVEAGLVYQELRRLRKKHPEIPVHAVIQDLGASGGYYIAVGADKIYADKASVVGSIGVRMENFGFVDSLRKLGVERRLLTAGKYKGLIDPFLPVDPVAQTHIQGLLDTIHKQFIAAVKEGRGKRLKDDPTLFTGLVWTGDQALPLGLIDGLGDVRQVARDVMDEEHLVDFTRRPDFLHHFGEQVGSSMARVLLSSGFTFR